MMDDFLPQFDVAERHEIIVRAPVERVYAVAREMDLSRARVTRWLLRMRGIWARSFTLNDFIKLRFNLLAERPNEELLLGLIGKFWTPAGGLLHVDAESFRRFAQPGYAKAVWNFAVAPQAEGATLLTTETRVLCLDEASRRRFRLYWTLIGPFSALIRREMLRTIKRTAEAGRTNRSD